MSDNEPMTPTEDETLDHEVDPTLRELHEIIEWENAIAEMQQP